MLGGVQRLAFCDVASAIGIHHGCAHRLKVSVGVLMSSLARPICSFERCISRSDASASPCRRWSSRIGPLSNGIPNLFVVKCMASLTISCVPGSRARGRRQDTSRTCIPQMPLLVSEAFGAAGGPKLWQAWVYHFRARHRRPILRNLHRISSDAMVVRTTVLIIVCLSERSSSF